MNPNELLAELQKTDWNNANASLWALFFEGAGENADWDVRPVKIKPELEQKLLSIVLSQLQKAQKARPYEYVTAELDEEETLVVNPKNDLLGDVAGDADPASALKEEVEYVGSISELLGAAGYLIRVESVSKTVVHGFKKMPETLRSIKKLFDVVVTRDFTLDAAEEEKRTFRLAKTIDAFHVLGHTFVTCKREFEIALRYRDAMRTSAQQTVKKLEKSGVFANAHRLLEGKEDHYMALRRLAGIGKNPRIQDQNWLKRVQELNTAHGWNLKFNETGQILLDDECIDLIMTLLRDRRALTLIYNEMIDADVAKTVGAP